MAKRRGTPKRDWISANRQAVRDSGFTGKALERELEARWKSHRGPSAAPAIRRARKVAQRKPSAAEARFTRSKGRAERGPLEEHRLPSARGDRQGLNQESQPPAAFSALSSAAPSGRHGELEDGRVTPPASGSNDRNSQIDNEPCVTSAEVQQVGVDVAPYRSSRLEQSYASVVEGLEENRDGPREFNSQGLDEGMPLQVQVSELPGQQSHDSSVSVHSETPDATTAQTDAFQDAPFAEESSDTATASRTVDVHIPCGVSDADADAVSEWSPPPSTPQDWSLFSQGEVDPGFQADTASYSQPESEDSAQTSPTRPRLNQLNVTFQLSQTIGTSQRAAIRVEVPQDDSGKHAYQLEAYVYNEGGQPPSAGQPSSVPWQGRGVSESQSPDDVNSTTRFESVTSTEDFEQQSEQSDSHIQGEDDQPPSAPQPGSTLWRERTSLASSQSLDEPNSMAMSESVASSAVDDYASVPWQAVRHPDASRAISESPQSPFGTRQSPFGMPRNPDGVHSAAVSDSDSLPDYEDYEEESSLFGQTRDHMA